MFQRRNQRTDWVDQLPAIVRLQPRGDRNLPAMGRRKVPTFYGIFACHQDRQIIVELEIARAIRVMIVEWMFDELQARGTQTTKKALWMTDAGNSMNGRTTETLETAPLTTIDDLPRNCGVKLHGQRRRSLRPASEFSGQRQKFVISIHHGCVSSVCGARPP
jgi:hypothetical protein